MYRQLRPKPSRDPEYEAKVERKLAPGSSLLIGRLPGGRTRRGGSMDLARGAEAPIRWTDEETREP